MQYDDTIIINLIAGACAGKSTIASGIFYKLKYSYMIFHYLF